MTVSLEALQRRLAVVEKEVIAWTARRDEAQQVLDRAVAELQRHETDKAQLERDIAGYTPMR